MVCLRKNPILIFIIFIIFVYPIHAGTTGKIVGNVTDASTGEALAGVNIMVENTAMGAATDLDGNYLIFGVPPGKYTLTANYVGYLDYRVQNVEVNIDKTTKIDFELRTATLELDETIEVIAERPLIKKDLTSTESSVNRELIESLPVETLNDVVNLQAGVVDGHFRGGRTGEVLYMVNGVSVTDVYSGSNEIEIENNAIQEVNVISGTFNAEYGHAMSGVVNVVTREGSDTYEGSISAYTGDYLSNNTNIFWGIDQFNPIANVQGTLSGSLPYLGKIKFFASGRYNKDSGYIYGKKIFVPTDYSNDFLNEENPEERIFQSRGEYYQFSEDLAEELFKDSKIVSMNNSERMTGNIKLSYRPTNTDKISLEGIYQQNEWREYAGDESHRFRYNPDGDYNYYKWGITGTLSWNHVFSPTTFMDIHGSYFLTEYEQHVYDDPFDSRYVEKFYLQQTGANAFLSGGQQMWHFNRSTNTRLLKAEITSQINLHHEFKAGVEGRQHKLWMHEFEVIPETPERIAPKTSFQNNEYTHYPIEFSAYIQDKMEYEDLVVNAGVRYDFFEPDGDIPVNFSDPGNSETKKAKPSYQISPRVGLAYPISEKGVIHVSYGHFFQIPQFQYLYTNPEFDIDPLQSDVSPPPESEKNIIGNAELKPQQTTIYELGLQQQLGELFGVSLTVFFKDIRNLLGTEVLKTIEGYTYGRYINRDYGYVRGITLDFEKRYSSGFAANIDYTYQVAEGNASDPNDAFLDAQEDKQTTKMLVPLNWDRRQQINASLNIGKPSTVAVSIIGRYGTGFPYTTVSRKIQPLVENGGRKPEEVKMDIYFLKAIQFSSYKFNVFLRVFNLFDRLNEINVYEDTGRATYSTAPVYFGGDRPKGLNKLDRYYIRPNFYSEPRNVQLGFEVEL